MAEPKHIICPTCGHQNALPLPKSRCVSCGKSVEAWADATALADDPYSQSGFNPAWFGIALVVTAVLTAAVVVGLPMVVRVLDFEGQAGMMVVIPVWCAAGILVGLISPGKTFFEPVVATFLVAIPVVFLLYRTQTVKTMPFFMYILMAALGVLFSLIGSYTGERIQMGPAPKKRYD